MTLAIVLGALSVAFLLVAFVCEWTARRLRQEPEGYVDTSRGTNGRPGPF